MNNGKEKTYSIGIALNNIILENALEDMDEAIKSELERAIMYSYPNKWFTKKDERLEKLKQERAEIFEKWVMVI